MADPRCPSCKETGTLRCAGCRDVQYCSIECQQTDWPIHKLLCATFKEFQDRPAENMRRTIVFPAHGNKPTFKWLPTKASAVGTWNIEEVDVSDYFEDFDYHTIVQNDITGASIRADRIRLYHGKNIRSDLPLNTAARAITGGQCAKSWRGALIVDCAYVTREGSKVSDMRLIDFTDIAAYLLDHDNESSAHALRKGPKVQCVKANCLDEQSRISAPAFTLVVVPRMHPVFEMPGKLSEISELVGMPLLMYKYSAARHGFHGKCHEKVTFMHPGCDRDVSVSTGTQGAFGWVALDWLGGKVPNVLIAHRDRLPLRPETVDIFGDFCHSGLQPLCEWHYEYESRHGQAASSLAKDVVLQQIMPAKWTQFLANAQEARRREVREVDRTIDDVADELSAASVEDDTNELERDTFYDQSYQPRSPEEVRRLLTRRQ